MEDRKIGDLVWRAEPLPWLYGSNVTLNVRGTQKMSLVFIMDYEVKGHPSRMEPYIKQLIKEVGL